jgi:predicted Rdx family selenoprotein
VAALIKQETGEDAALEEGARGELSVWVDDRQVAQKDHKGFPADAVLIAAVRDAMAE